MSNRIGALLIGFTFVGTAIADMARRSDWDVLAFLALRIELIAGAALLCVLVFEFGVTVFEMGKTLGNKIVMQMND